MKILEDTENIFKTMRNLLAFFIRLERFENRGGNLKRKMAELQWTSQELQKIIGTTRILLEEEKSKE